MQGVAARAIVLAAAVAGFTACAGQSSVKAAADPTHHDSTVHEDVNARQGDGSTPLQWAVPVRNDLAKVLTDLGANVENPNLPPWPPVPTPTITAQVPD